MKTPRSKRDQQWDEDGLSEALRTAREHAEPTIDQSHLNALKDRLKAIPETQRTDRTAHEQKSTPVMQFRKRIVALSAVAAAAIVILIFTFRSVNLDTENCTSFECMLASYTLNASDVSDMIDEEVVPFNGALTGGLFAGLDDELLEEYLFDSNTLDDEIFELMELD